MKLTIRTIGQSFKFRRIKEWTLVKSNGMSQYTMITYSGKTKGLTVPTPTVIWVRED